MHVEVKNYDLTSSSSRYNLYKELADQAAKRAQNLPKDSVQGVILDIRGQSIDPAVLQRIPANIEKATGGLIRAANVVFKRN
jgi:filamentous hemagglutinin